MMRALLFLVATGICSAQEAFLIRNVRVFDGSAVRERTSVLISGGVIGAVGPNVTSVADAKEIDGTGKTLLPGLIDAHTHISRPDDLRQALAFGVTTELDMFSWPTVVKYYKGLQRTGQTGQMADARFAGICATAPSGHGTEYGLPIPVIRGREGAETFVDARIAEGSDYIKVIYGSGTRPSISRVTLTALIRAAHSRGKMAVVHINSLQDAREAVEAGADGLAHIFRGGTPDPEFALLAKRRGTFVVPTLSVRSTACNGTPGKQFADDPRFVPDLMRSAIATLSWTPTARSEASCDGGPKTVLLLRDAGVPILAGTDPLNRSIAHGVSLHGELALLVEAGLTPIEALAAATTAPADRFRLWDRGRILPGKRADLVLVDGNPLADIHATRNIVAVWKEGRLFDRVAYRAAVKKFDDPIVPAGSDSGLISDFEDPTISTRFGSSWYAFGGIRMTLIAGGANGTRHSLAIAGEIEADRAPDFWPGITTMPASADIPLLPAELSSWQGVEFWAKGDGETYRMILGTSSGYHEQSFVAGQQWVQYRFPFRNFDSSGGSSVNSIILAAQNKPGPFALQIDEVKLFGKKRRGR